MIAIIDYNMGNVGSIQNMIKKLGKKSIVTNNHKEIKNCKFLILPGVGSFDSGVKNLKKYNLFNLLKEIANEGKTQILGICLGMQLLCKTSEEGSEKGLGLIDASIIRFPKSKDLKIPHMGWNYVHPHEKSLLLKNYEEIPKFYFVHSYYMKCNNNFVISAKANYGIKFDCAFEINNIHGVQFHPEKSHKYGINLFKNFFNIIDNNG